MRGRASRHGLTLSWFSGSNLQALIDSTRDPKSSSHIVVVISNKAGVAGLDKAEKAGIPTRVINHKLYKNRVEFDNAVDLVLEEFSVDVVCLAGFMRILSGPFVRKWDGKQESWTVNGLRSNQLSKTALIMKF